GSRHDNAKEALWDSILKFTYENIDHIIHTLQRSFNDNEDVFADFIAIMFGINDLEKEGANLDRELGDRVISLHQTVKYYDGSMRELNLIIQSASEMTRVLLHLQTRFRYLFVKARFSDELYKLICTLGFPERVYSTLVRAARTSRTFEHVTFHLRPMSPPKRVSFATPATNARPAAQKAAVDPQPQPQPQPAAIGLGALLDTAQPYLAQEDRGIGLIRLSPASKQDASQLVGTVLRGQMLPVQTNAWYAFGFVTAKYDAEEQHLAGFYAVLLKEAQNPEAIFRELLCALETNTLVSLFDIKQYNHFRKLFPRLEKFLKTPHEERSTVWRLQQFIKDVYNTEPPACLQRDYGFKYCKQREEVMLLKDIYSRMLKKLGPDNLHHACVRGELFKTAIQEGIAIEPKYYRLTKNDYTSPFIGYDNNKGLDAYRGTLFKGSLKL
ncbi:hypothetical protein EJ02DRAFT_498479, partial [Clathrospora elynae]